MKCQDARMLVGLADDDPRAVAKDAHLQACAECRAEVARQDRMLALIALKRYEQPPADFSRQCAARIRRALEQQSPAQNAWWQALGDYVAVAFRPAWMAAAAVILVSLGIYLLYPAGEGIAPATAPASWAQIHLETLGAPASAAVPPSLAVTQANLPILLASSNNAPLRMDYGPGTAVPVNFEY